MTSSLGDHIRKRRKLRQDAAVREAKDSLRGYIDEQIAAAKEDIDIKIADLAMRNELMR